MSSLQAWNTLASSWLSALALIPLVPSPSKAYVFLTGQSSQTNHGVLKDLILTFLFITISHSVPTTMIIMVFKSKFE